MVVRWRRQPQSRENVLGVSFDGLLCDEELLGIVRL
jgi:hypothetical protein